MKMKKILSAALAGVMTVALAVPALASGPTPVRPVAETTESSFAVELEGMIYTPTIRVQVTESGSVYVNPSKSVVAGTMTKALDGTIDLDYSFSGQTVISTPILIRSDTESGLTVSATATATVPTSSGVTLVDAATSDATKGKEVSLQLGGSDTALGNSDALKTTPASGSTPAAPGLDQTDFKAATSGKLTAATDKKSASLTTAVEVANIDGATLNKDAAGKVTTAVPQYGVVVVTGKANDKAANWTENDIVNVTLALTFSLA